MCCDISFNEHKLNNTEEEWNQVQLVTSLSTASTVAFSWCLLASNSALSARLVSSVFFSCRSWTCLLYASNCVRIMLDFFNSYTFNTPAKSCHLHINDISMSNSLLKTKCSVQLDVKGIENRWSQNPFQLNNKCYLSHLLYDLTQPYVGCLYCVVFFIMLILPCLLVYVVINC